MTDNKKITDSKSTNDTPSTHKSKEAGLKPTSLENAPEHIKLAVDLLVVLEQNDIKPKVALDALEVVKADLLNQIKE